MNEAAEILIIDDDPDIVEALQIMLESKSYRVRSAFDGQEGLREAKKKKTGLDRLRSGSAQRGRDHSLSGVEGKPRVF